jgi:glycosyltransferase involved in cell wall biosynthesis
MTPEKMTLCLLNYEYPPIGAGAASATKEIAESLTRLGHEVVVVTAGIGAMIGDSIESGVRTVRLACRRKRRDRASLLEMLSFLFAARRQLPAILRSNQCRGIICFFSLPCGPAAWSASRKTGIPYVVSLRGGDVPGLEPSINWLHRLLTPVRRAVLKGALVVIANSDGLRKVAESSDPFAVSVIPNGVNTTQFSPATRVNHGGAFRVLAVGRLQEQKNHAFALRVLSNVRARIAQPLEYHIVGDGPLRLYIECAAEQLGLAKQLFWHGWVSRESLADIYRSCHCLLHPTLYEGMPNAVLEAMAAGLPVVASDVEGNSDVVRSGETGYVCSLKDEAAFCDALTQLARDDTLRQRLGRSARLVAETEYTWDRVGRQYVDLFRAAPSRTVEARLTRQDGDRQVGGTH